MENQKNNVCFEFENQMIISSSIDEVENWINALKGIKCNEHTHRNIELILNTEWKTWGAYNQHKSPFNKDGFRLEYLKPTGIKTGQISFSLTHCNTVTEFCEEREKFLRRVQSAKLKVADISNLYGNQLLEKLSKKSKSCVDLFHSSGLRFIIRIGTKGYWCNIGGNHQWCYIDEYFTHFDGESLISDEGKNIIDILKQFINEN